MAGKILPGGMLYVGSRLAAIQRWVGREPALVDPSLPVQWQVPDVEGRLMHYWPSYSDILPASRAAYLQWLAGGRCAPETGIGYVFLFFYGLERRLLHDHARSPLQATEAAALHAEIERLLTVYGSRSSFQGYASSLLGLAALQRRSSLDLSDLHPPLVRSGWTLPLSLRLALGLLAGEGKPLPPEWALSWVLCSPEVALRTPALRCREELRQLFHLRYRESFGDGLSLRADKTRLKVEYQPASASFGGPISFATDLPDVTAAATRFEELRNLLDRCTQELDPYSRWVGRGGDADSPPAVALLPAPLARGRGNEATRALSEWLEARLEGRECALLESSELLSRWPVPQEGRPTRRDLVMLSDFLASRGLGLEPDVGLGGSSLSKTRHAALFRLPGGAAEPPSPAYAGAAALLHLAATVATADGEVNTAEEAHLLQHLETALALPAGDRARLEAHFRWLAADPPSLTRAKKGLEAIPAEDRRGFGTFLLSLAGADGHLAPGEVKVLTRIYSLLGLEPQSLYSDMHQLMSAEGGPATEPVAVRPGAKPQGFAIPRPPETAVPPQGVALDLEKVRAKIIETASVSRILGEIFVDEPDPVPAAPPAPPPLAPPVAAASAPVPVVAVAGLDAAHSALLLKLAPAPAWERGEVERMAKELGLLPDGALEVINEAAFAACGAPLLEGEDPIEIDPEILQEMLP